MNRTQQKRIFLEKSGFYSNFFCLGLNLGFRVQGLGFGSFIRDWGLEQNPGFFEENSV